jgi:hypothetical protein
MIHTPLNANHCPKCDGKASWGYGYASGQGLGGYLMCDSCMYTLKFQPEEEVNETNAPFWMVWNPAGTLPDAQACNG